MLGALTLAIAFNGARSLSRADADYADLVNNKLPATTKMARLSRNMTQVAYAGYRTIVRKRAARLHRCDPAAFTSIQA